MKEWLLDFYLKNKEKIWGAVIALLIAAGGTMVNDAVLSVPAIKEINTRVQKLEERVTQIENDVYDVVKDKE